MTAARAHGRSTARLAPARPAPLTDRHRAGRLTVVPAARPHRVPFLIGVVLTALVLVAFGFAAFHTALAETQYELEQVERELQLDRQRLESLQFQLDEFNSPAKIEQSARGILGLVDPEDPVDLVVSDELLAEVTGAVTTGGGR